MSSPAANPQHEPTMEEILASIRKIISEDQPEAAAKPAAQPVPLRAVPSEPPPAPAPAATAELDVLELTDEVKEEAAPVAAASPAPAVIENDIVFESIDPAPAPEPDDEEEETDELISTSTRSAVSRAFASMDKGPVEYKAPGGGAIETIFVQAVQSAFQPTLQEWVDSHNAEILDTLKPLIRAWMDEHLPPLIEAAVAKEITRAAKRKR